MIAYWKPFAIITVVATVTVLFFSWLREHDKNTLAGYVALSEKQAAEAKAQEAQRQADASAAALQSINDQIAKAKAQEAAKDAEQEKQISEYETQLVAAKRDCRLSPDDVRVLQHNGSAKALPVGHH